MSLTVTNDMYGGRGEGYTICVKYVKEGMVFIHPRTTIRVPRIQSQQLFIVSTPLGLELGVISFVPQVPRALQTAGVQFLNHSRLMKMHSCNRA